MVLLVASLSIFTPFVAGAGITGAVSIPPVSTLNVVPFPISLGYNPSNGDVYVGSFNGSVSVISGTKVIGSIPSSKIGYTAQAFTYSPPNQAMYVAGGGGVSSISSLNSAASVPYGGSTSQTLVYDPSNSFVYVANLGWIAILANDNTMKGSMVVNLRPGGFVFDGFDNYTYASYLIQDKTGSYTGTQVYILSGVNLIGNVTLGGGMGGFVAPESESTSDPFVWLGILQTKSQV